MGYIEQILGYVLIFKLQVVERQNVEKISETVEFILTLTLTLNPILTLTAPPAWVIAK
jgi:hypothetical protein